MTQNTNVRLTLEDIKKYPTPLELYQELTQSKGWNYATPQPDDLEGLKKLRRFRMRDKALAALLYLGDFRISEVLPLKKEQFTKGKGFIHVESVLVGKRKANSTLYREAKLPLKGERATFTRLILDYLELLDPGSRLFPFSLTKRKYPIKGSTYKNKDGTVKQRFSFQMVGTKRAWQIIKALFPHYTQHWLRAFGYDYDYDHMAHDIIAVSDKTKADPRSLQVYLRRRYDKYPVR
jgi:hypothetical protein